MSRPGISESAFNRRLRDTSRKLDITPIGDVEEVNMFKNDGNIIHMPNPRGEDHQSVPKCNQRVMLQSAIDGLHPWIQYFTKLLFLVEFM